MRAAKPRASHAAQPCGAYGGDAGGGDKTSAGGGDGLLSWPQSTAACATGSLSASHALPAGVHVPSL